MIEEPDSRALCIGIPYWVIAFFVLPGLISLMFIPTGHDHIYSLWIEIGYHVLNFIVVLFAFLPFLRESFFTLQYSTKKVFGTAAAASGAIITLKMIFIGIAGYTQNELLFNAAYGTVLANESDLMYYSSALMAYQPLWGTLTLVFLAPFTVSCLLYACVFAPVCKTRPALAYLLVTLLTLLIRLSVAFCLWPLQEELVIYILLLPIHLIACWAYQRTDTIWTPIIVHFFSNLFFAGYFHAIFGIGG